MTDVFCCGLATEFCLCIQHLFSDVIEVHRDLRASKHAHTPTRCCQERCSSTCRWPRMSSRVVVLAMLRAGRLILCSGAGGHGSCGSRAGGHGGSQLDTHRRRRCSGAGGHGSCGSRAGEAGRTKIDTVDVCAYAGCFFCCFRMSLIQRDVIAMILVQRAAKNDAHQHATDTQASPADTAAAEVAPEDTEGKVAARQGIRSPGAAPQLTHGPDL